MGWSQRNYTIAACLLRHLKWKKTAIYPRMHSWPRQLARPIEMCSSSSCWFQPRSDCVGSPQMKRSKCTETRCLGAAVWCSQVSKLKCNSIKFGGQVLNSSTLNLWRKCFFFYDKKQKNKFTASFLSLFQTDSRTERTLKKNRSGQPGS